MFVLLYKTQMSDYIILHIFKDENSWYKTKKIHMQYRSEVKILLDCICMGGITIRHFILKCVSVSVSVSVCVYVLVITLFVENSYIKRQVFLVLKNTNFTKINQDTEKFHLNECAGKIMYKISLKYLLS